MACASARPPICSPQGKGSRPSWRCAWLCPDLPVVAALSASHLAALILPPSLRRLYITVDSDAVGRDAADRLAERAGADGIEAIRLTSRLEDVNEDLRAFGLTELRADLRPQLAPEDVERLLPSTNR
jgi:DNA primase